MTLLSFFPLQPPPGSTMKLAREAGLLDAPLPSQEEMLFSPSRSNGRLVADVDSCVRRTLQKSFRKLESILQARDKNVYVVTEKFLKMDREGHPLCVVSSRTSPRARPTKKQQILGCLPQREVYVPVFSYEEVNLGTANLFTPLLTFLSGMPPYSLSLILE